MKIFFCHEEITLAGIAMRENAFKQYRSAMGRALAQTYLARKRERAGMYTTNDDEQPLLIVVVPAGYFRKSYAR